MVKLTSREMSDRSETTTACIDFVTKSLRTGPFAPKTRHRSSYLTWSQLSPAKKYPDRLADARRQSRSKVHHRRRCHQCPTTRHVDFAETARASSNFSLSRRWEFRCNTIVGEGLDK